MIASVDSAVGRPDEQSVNIGLSLLSSCRLCTLYRYPGYANGQVPTCPLPFESCSDCTSDYWGMGPKWQCLVHPGNQWCLSVLPLHRHHSSADSTCWIPCTITTFNNLVQASRSFPLQSATSVQGGLTCRQCWAEVGHPRMANLLSNNCSEHLFRCMAH